MCVFVCVSVCGLFVFYLCFLVIIREIHMRFRGPKLYAHDTDREMIRGMYLSVTLIDRSLQVRICLCVMTQIDRCS